MLCQIPHNNYDLHRNAQLIIPAFLSEALAGFTIRARN